MKAFLLLALCACGPGPRPSLPADAGCPLGSGQAGPYCVADGDAECTYLDGTADGWECPLDVGCGLLVGTCG